MAKFAFLVGVDAYAQGLTLATTTPLRALDGLHDALRDRGLGGFQSVRRQHNPGREGLSRALLDWSAGAGRGDLLLLYVAGAGLVDAAGRAHLLLPGYSGTLRPESSIPLSTILNGVRLSGCIRRVLLLDIGFIAPDGLPQPGAGVLAGERMTLPDTAVLASAAGEPFAAVDGVVPERRLLGSRLIQLLTTPTPGAAPVLTVQGLHETLRRETPATERRDVPRLWLGHVHRGSLVLAHNRASRPRTPRSRTPPARRRQLLPHRPDVGQDGQRRVPGWGRGTGVAEPPARSQRRLRVYAGAKQPAHARRRGSRAGRGRGLLRVPARLAGLALLGPVALFLAGEDASRDLQVAGAKLLHRAAPAAFEHLFVEHYGAIFSDPLRGGGRGPALAVLPGGFFMMGSYSGEPERHSTEGPMRRVGVDPFALGIAEVAFAEYDRFAQATGRPLPADGGWGRGNRPVINVSWEDAAAYARWLSEETGEHYFLPTEAQWEYAARAGTDTPFASGGCIHTDQANYNGVFDYAGCGARTGIFRGATLPATALPPNRWGLFHMHGNVWEWVRDCWQPAYRESVALFVRAGEAVEDRDCGRRVIRGGGWRFEPGFLRSAARIWSRPGTRNSDIGFRVARALD